MSSSFRSYSRFSLLFRYLLMRAVSDYWPPGAFPPMPVWVKLGSELTVINEVG